MVVSRHSPPWTDAPPPVLGEGQLSCLEGEYPDADTDSQKTRSKRDGLDLERPAVYTVNCSLNSTAPFSS